MNDIDEEIANVWDTGNKAGGAFNWETSSGRSAYILVYEKKKKKDLTLEFTEANFTSKDEILKNLVEEDQLALVKEEKRETSTVVHIPYYGIRPYIDPKLEVEVKEDNYRFLMEQHVYSKEFLNFVTKASAFPQLGDFNPKTVPRRLVESKMPERMKTLLAQTYDIQMRLFQTVLARTEDNEVMVDEVVRRQVRSQHAQDHLALSRTLRRLDHKRPIPLVAERHQHSCQLPRWRCKTNHGRSSGSPHHRSLQLLRG